MKPTGWIQRCVTLILRSRWPTVVVVALVAVWAGYFAAQITLDTSLETWFLEDDATLVAYKEFRHKFGEDEFVVLSVEAENVFTPEILRKLERLTEIAEEVPLVQGVISLTNVKVIRRLGRSKVVSLALMKQLPQTPEDAAEFREDVAAYPLVAGNLASDDGRAAAVVVELSRECDTFEKKAAVVRGLATLCREHFPELRIRLAGTPVASDAISRYLQKDFSILTPAAFVVVVVCILLLFRRLTVSLICSSVVGLSALCVVGVMGMLGIQMNLLGPVLIMIILVVGVADSIHIFTAYFQQRERVETRLEALDRALGHVFVPCLVTSVTTIVGFLSLLSSELKPIRHFGALAALGAGLAFLLSFFLISASIQLLPAWTWKPRSTSNHTTMNRLLKWLGRPTPRVAWMVLALSTLIVVPGTWSPKFIKVTANPMYYFHSDDPVRTDAEAVDKTLGGAASLEFMVRAPDGGMQDLGILRRLDKFEVYLEELPAVSQVMSFGTLLKEQDRIVRGKKDQRGRCLKKNGALPSSSGSLFRAKNAMRRVAKKMLDSYVQDDFSLGRISARIQTRDADKLASQAPVIEGWVRENVTGPGLEVEPTGFVKLMDEMRSYLVESQVYSVILAFASITITLCIAFRSWKLALFSMIPNVGPVIMGVALMAVLDIRLDPGTVMIATIALGLVVDDTCHFLIRLRGHVRNRMSLPDAIAETMSQTGRPIILTSIILSAGFAVLMLGSFTPTMCFGQVSTFVLLTALVADLVVLPAALLILQPKL